MSRIGLALDDVPDQALVFIRPPRFEQAPSGEVAGGVQITALLSMRGGDGEQLSNVEARERFEKDVKSSRRQLLLLQSASANVT
jgi:hypothetical protein